MTVRILTLDELYELDKGRTQQFGKPWRMCHCGRIPYFIGTTSTFPIRPIWDDACIYHGKYANTVHIAPQF